MCFHGNQHPWAIKYPFISLYSKYQSFKYICLPVMNSPVFPCLDDIYCTCSIVHAVNAFNGNKRVFGRHKKHTQGLAHLIL